MVNKTELPITIQRSQQVGSLHLMKTVDILGNNLNSSPSSSLTLHSLNNVSSSYFLFLFFLIFLLCLLPFLNPNKSVGCYF